MTRGTRVRRVAAVLFACATILGRMPDAHAYLKLGTNLDDGTTVSLKWSAAPVRYFVNDTQVPGVDADALRRTVERAFATWQDVPTASVAFEFAGFTSAPPLDEDNASTLGFLDRPDLDRVLASTSFVVDTRTGEILESDIFFNSAFPWSVADAGETDRFDLLSIAVHETGHFLGLGHSALGETEPASGGGRRLIAAGSVMFPIAFGPGILAGRTLQPDDVAGVSDLYPDDDFRGRTGSIQGTVTKNGAGVFGAHAAALDLRTGAIVASFTLAASGEFVIAGLAPGVYVVRVEPLNDADVDSFFDAATPVDLAFAPAISDHLAIVPRGGTSDRIELQVTDR